jgi:hypothetical protein
MVSIASVSSCSWSDLLNTKISRTSMSNYVYSFHKGIIVATVVFPLDDRTTSETGFDARGSPHLTGLDVPWEARLEQTCSSSPLTHIEGKLRCGAQSMLASMPCMFQTLSRLQADAM